MGIKSLEIIAIQYETAVIKLGSPLLNALLKAQENASKATQKARKLYEQYINSISKR